MTWISSINQWSERSPALVGGKGSALVRLHQAGVAVPETICITTSAYRRFLSTGGLAEKIQLELNKKPFTEMRWEEIWDIALRIRHLFVTTAMDRELANQLWQTIAATFGDRPLAVRSSAPEEDHYHSSFAGLHDSLLNVRGRTQVLQAIRRVWGSLWSDRALLYRQELQLAPGSSAMAVIIQELLAGETSGIVFTISPLSPKMMMIEAVHGLNQGLVDGDIEPDRWQIDRSSGQIVDHRPPELRSSRMTAADSGVTITPLSADRRATAPLDQEQLRTIADTALAMEHYFSHPLDLEWTWHQGRLLLLQARPITALDGGKGNDQRAWYLSLHRSFANLTMLRTAIEDEMLPAMAKETEAMAVVVSALLPDGELAAEIRHRLARASHWSKAYWDDCIPFAHGIRLFGEIYNDLLAPADPYEFVQLLAGETMLSTSRNQLLAGLAAKVRNNPELAARLADDSLDTIDDQVFLQDLARLERKFGNSFGHGDDARTLLAALLREYARLPMPAEPLDRPDRHRLEQRFLTQAAQAALAMDGSRLLELARASYRLRDDDNIYLGGIEHQLQLAVEEGRRRLVRSHSQQGLGLATPEEIAALLAGDPVTITGPAAAPAPNRPSSSSAVRARQLPGQPASRGIARGRARVITGPDVMADFQAGEILVVDAVDPNMTFLAPLAGAIVERRGGMLIHGAIIAREYGIPCVTGVTGATEFIASGDTVTVDGYLGLVTIDR